MTPVSPGQGQIIIGRDQPRSAASPPEQQTSKEARQQSQPPQVSEPPAGGVIGSQSFGDPLFDLDIDWYAEQELYTEETLLQSAVTGASLDERASVPYLLWLDPAAEDVTRPQSDPELIPALAAAQMEGSAEAAGTSRAAHNTKSVRTQPTAAPIPLPVKAPRVHRSWVVSESVADVLYGPRVVILLGLTLISEMLIAGLIMDAGYAISIL